LRYYSRIFWGDRKITEISGRTASLWAKIQTWELPNTKQKCYPLNSNIQGNDVRMDINKGVDGYITHLQ
jgi:hypothetical protein